MNVLKGCYVASKEFKDSILISSSIIASKIFMDQSHSSKNIFHGYKIMKIRMNSSIINFI